MHLLERLLVAQRDARCVLGTLSAGRGGLRERVELAPHQRHQAVVPEVAGGRHGQVEGA